MKTNWFKRFFQLFIAPKAPPLKGTRAPVTLASGPQSLTTGERNHNPLNVKGTGWKYSIGNDSRGHAIFTQNEAGIRAAIIVLRTYWVKHRLRSVAAILSRWAPSTDTIGSLPGAPSNSPAEYTRFVSRNMGIGPNDTLRTFDDEGRIKDAAEVFNLLSAMARYEIRSSYVLDRQEFYRAVGLV